MAFRPSFADSVSQRKCYVPCEDERTETVTLRRQQRSQLAGIELFHGDEHRFESFVRLGLRTARRQALAQGLGRKGRHLTDAMARLGDSAKEPNPLDVLVV